MDVSDFKATRGPVTTTVAPPAARGAAIPTLPPTMAEQAPPSAIDLEAAPEAPADAAAPTEAEPSSIATTTEEVLAAAVAPDETVVEQTTATEEPAPTKVDPKFSALARKEAQLYREREELKAQKAALEQAHRQVVAFEEARQVARRDPLAALEALGITYDALTEHVLNGGKPTPNAEVAAVREELAQLRAEQEAARARAEELASARLAEENQAVIEEARQAAVAFTEANVDRYELTAANNGASLVPQVREQHFARTGKLLTIEQAADLVEKHFEGVADRIAKARKFQTKIAPPPRAPPATPAATPPAAQRTLSNALTASASTAPAKARSETDRIRAALARLEGK